MAEEKRVTKVQELLYELTVSDVMKHVVISIPVETKMSELRDILRSGHISGAPVVDGDELVGIISLQDFIDWLAEGQPDTSVAQRMTSDVEGVYVDDSLVSAVEKFEKHGFGRFPVITRKDRRVIGIITKGTIVQGLLEKLAIIRREEEDQNHSVSRIFEEIVANKVSLVLEFRIAGRDFQNAGASASGLKRALKHLNVHPRIIRRAAVATYEAEMNMVIYGEGGEILVNIEPHRIQIEAIDSGPGIPDVEKAMQPGYSTATEWIREMGFGAGMGLSNIKKCADVMDLTSTVGKGTRLKVTINIHRKD
ncbi:CBS domain-containing protein [candidate division TA06 bacterium]|uniref:CBS domain-containing protein n=1 Tax=candidate division TA06 bacterium TaxID=2250710 RepID=A0A523UXT7_UNCT6|nr:MAG: CBS domain-containing protein [candidate division TA06 bacterium]